MYLAEVDLRFGQIASCRPLEIMVRLLLVNGSAESISMYDAQTVERFAVTLQ